MTAIAPLTQPSRILLVEDTPALLQVCALTLRQAAHEVATAPDAEEALILLAEQPFDVLLVDQMLPRMSGLELAQQAQALYPLLDVIVMTGYTSIELLEDALQYGVADFLPKPFELESLRLAVARTLERQRLRRENLRLQALAQVVEVSRAFATTLDPAAIATVLADAIQRQTALPAVWVVLPNRLLYAASGNAPSGGEQPGKGATTLRSMPLIAHGKIVGQLWLTPTPTLPSADVVQVLMELGALALHNAAVFASLTDLEHEKNEFIALASHELRTPLAVMLGYAALLQDKLAPRQNQQMDEILRSALRLKDVVDDLINLHELREGATVVSFAPVALRTVATTVQRELQPFARQRGVRLVCQASGQALVATVAEAHLLAAVSQLVHNALRFTPPGGTVRLTLAQQAPVLGGNVVFVVDDTGMGIPAHELHHIFKRFYQVADSRTRQEGGLGVGLALTQLVAELHGGALRAQSVQGRGSRFVLSLPAHLVVR